MKDSKRRLGRSDLLVSPIGLGCWQFSKGKGMTGRYWSALSDDEIAEIVALSLEESVNWFDTAESYGGGESERALARSLRRLDVDVDSVVIATKWWPFLRTARSITRTIDRRLEALDVPCIDLYQIHLPFSFSSVRAEMQSMAQLVKVGKVSAVGLSNYSANGMKTASQELEKHNINLVSNQVEFNLLNRNIETNGILKAANELGITIIAYSPLAQGLLTGKYHSEPRRARQLPSFRKIYNPVTSRRLKKSQPVIDVIRDLANKYHVSPSQIALNWVIHVHGERIVTIAGASKASQAKDNASALNFKLSEEDIARLDDVSLAYASS